MVRGVSIGSRIDAGAGRLDTEHISLGDVDEPNAQGDDTETTTSTKYDLASPGPPIILPQGNDANGRVPCDDEPQHIAAAIGTTIATACAQHALVKNEGGLQRLATSAESAAEWADATDDSNVDSPELTRHGIVRHATTTGATLSLVGNRSNHQHLRRIVTAGDESTRSRNMTMTTLVQGSVSTGSRISAGAGRLSTGQISLGDIIEPHHQADDAVTTTSTKYDLASPGPPILPPCDELCEEDNDANGYVSCDDEPNQFTTDGTMSHPARPMERLDNIDTDTVELEYLATIPRADHDVADEMLDVDNVGGVESNDVTTAVDDQ